MGDDKMGDQLEVVHENLMAVLDSADTDVMWCEDKRGILIFARNTDDPELTNFIKPLKRALGMNVDGETVQ